MNAKGWNPDALDGIAKVCASGTYGKVNRDEPNTVITKEQYKSVMDASIGDKLIDFSSYLEQAIWSSPPDNRTPEEKAEDDARHAASQKEYNRWPNRFRRWRGVMWYKMTRPLHRIGPCDCDESECDE